MSEKPIFYDAKGRRPKRAVGVGATVLTVAVAVATVVFVSVLFLLPFIPGLPGSARPMFLRSTHPPLLSSSGDVLKQTEFLLSKARRELQDQTDSAIKLRKGRRSQGNAVNVPPVPPDRPIIAAFYAPWLETSWMSLKRNATKITHLMPDWLHLSANGTGLDERDYDLALNPYNVGVHDIVKNYKIALFPVLNNAGLEGKFEANGEVHRLLASQKAQQGLIGTVTDWLVSHECQGLNVDFEELRDDDYPKLGTFLGRLRQALHSRNLKLSVDMEMQQLSDAASSADNADFVVLMDYDQHAEDSQAGPIAPIDWFSNNITQALAHIPANKLVIGIGNYGYDWSTDQKGQLARSISYQEAVTNALEARDDLPPSQRIVFDRQSLNSHYSYEDDDGHHEVWLLDGPSAYNQYKFVREANLRGSALWVLGEEDPTVWNFMDRRQTVAPTASQALSTVSFPYEISFNGEGEILSMNPAFTNPSPGERIVQEDATSGMCAAATYKTYPRPVVLDRTGLFDNNGRTPKLVALTFDDGPDPTWTPQVLDTLEQFHVPATFFCIGENIIEHPGLVRREFNDGDEIGNHSFYHPNLATVSQFRAKLEIEATQRAIQSILGRSSLLFRPPYDADTDPSTAQDIKPVAIASSLGYFTVGASIDAEDWDLTVQTADGKTRVKTAQDIATQLVNDTEQCRGNVVLLHDAGGDRHLTVEALKIAIPKLKADGFQFIGISRLIRMAPDHQVRPGMKLQPNAMAHFATRDDVMPRVSGKDLILMPFEKIAVYGWYALATFLTLAFLVAIGLGVARILVITPLAVVANRKRVGYEPYAPEDEPHVSVIIAAYNEEPVISRTVRSVLSSSYKNLEVIVVDDGSKDATYEILERDFAEEPRIRLLRQENAGKANALRTGMQQAAGEIYVYLDADTILAQDAISKLAAHFRNPRVGAVAGNVKVGNRVNMLTRLQALEYISSQNLDRKAYSHVNAVTVVPGAIGAWRKQAVFEAGGYSSDTLAEDMDLTWRVRLSGWKIDNESEAVAYTEAPENVRSFFKQRFRWTFGTLQCLFKHHRALGRKGWFGSIVLPSLWLYQFGLQVIAPFVDIQLLYTGTVFISAYATKSVLTKDWRPLPDAAHTMATVGFLYALFFIVELVGAWIAFGMDKERKGLLWWLFLQRVIYRQVLYMVVWKAIWAAARGARTGWGKFERKGSVPGPTPSKTSSKDLDLEPVGAGPLGADR